MRRQKRKSNTRFLLPVIVAVALLFTGHIAVDQYRLFTRYHTQIAEKKTQIKLLESEVRELETDLKEAESLPFIMKYAIKYGMIPTESTPVPVTLPAKPEELAETEAEETPAR